MGNLISCAHAPAPSSYAASHPHVYTPYIGTAGKQSSEEDQLTRMQLALLDPPNTMSMVGQAVDSHRRALEEEQRLRDFTTRANLKNPKGKKSIGVTAPTGTPSQTAGPQTLQADLTGLGPTCGTGYSGGNFSDPRMTSVMLQKSCLLPGDGRKGSYTQKLGIRLSGIQGNLWDAVRAGLVLYPIENDRINAFMAYLRQKPGTVDFLMGRAEPYLQYLVGELRRQGLPTDLVLVPMVESAYQTTAVSPKQAAGLWQFVPSTGQQYGLRLSETYDGRYDTHLATQAALRYLGYLNQLFGGDWTLALAAYNAGEGTVTRAIQANRVSGGRGTFWELSLPQETQNYVLKIITLSRIIANPNGNGFIPRNAQASASLTLVETRPGLGVQELISRSGISTSEFFRLNPHVRPDISPPPEARAFMLPSDRAQFLLASSTRTQALHGAKKIRVRSGEGAVDVAKRAGVPLKQLLEWNGLGPKDKLRGGQELNIQGV